MIYANNVKSPSCVLLYVWCVFSSILSIPDIATTQKIHYVMSNGKEFL